MLAIRLTKPNAEDPLSAIEVSDAPPAPVPDGWVTVTLKAAAVNHSDLWSMRSYGADPGTLPVVLGADGAGIDEDGNEVIVYPIVASRQRGLGDEMHDPGLRMLSQGIDGTFATQVAVPRENLVPKPAELSWEAAACLGTAWLTAYRMLFGKADLKPGETVLVQGAGGGVSTALITLGRIAGLRVWVTSRDAERGRRAVRELGAAAAFVTGEPLPGKVDAVLDSVGGATFAHSLSSLRPGGRLVAVGTTSGASVELDLTKIAVGSLSVLGSAMGSPAELDRLARLCATTGTVPMIDSVRPLADGVAGIERLLAGAQFGKVVFRCA